MPGEAARYGPHRPRDSEHHDATVLGLAFRLDVDGDHRLANLPVDPTDREPIGSVQRKATPSALVIAL